MKRQRDGSLGVAIRAAVVKSGKQLSVKAA